MKWKFSTDIQLMNFVLYYLACAATDFMVFNDLCLMISEIKLSWYEAQRYCEDKGGHLIVLDSETKHNSCLDFIYNCKLTINIRTEIWNSCIRK